MNWPKLHESSFDVDQRAMQTLARRRSAGTQIGIAARAFLRKLCDNSTDRPRRFPMTDRRRHLIGASRSRS
jgi:hypothetical protein